MTILELARACTDAICGCAMMNIEAEDAKALVVTPKGWRPPKGFPRRDIVQVKENGDRVSYVPAMRVLCWMVANGMVKVSQPGDVAGAGKAV